MAEKDRMYADNYAQMDILDADRECRCVDRRELVSSKCPVCAMTILLHCNDCKIQISGCFCVEEMKQGTEKAKQKMIENGIWVPAWGDRPKNFGGRP